MKELKEAAFGIGMLAGEIHEVSKDGLGWEDLNSLIDMANDFSLYQDAVEGADKVLEEIQKLDLVSAQEILAKLFEGFKRGAE